MPMTKKANGSNFQTGGGAITFEFDAGAQQVVYVVCLWGPKPQFGGQRPKVWCSEKLDSAADGKRVTIPFEGPLTGMQVTWSGGVIAKEDQASGKLTVAISQVNGEGASYDYDFNFQKAQDHELFYDGVNLV